MSAVQYKIFIFESLLNYNAKNLVVVGMLVYNFEYFLSIFTILSKNYIKNNIKIQFLNLYFVIFILSL